MGEPNQASSALIAQWYETYGALVYRRCMHLLANDADATDAVQETYMRAMRAKPVDIKEPLAWLYTVANRICLDGLSRRRGEPTALGVLSKLRERWFSSDASAGSPEDRVCLGSVLLALDKTTREMAVLHWLDGFTQEEVATQTGYSRKTVGTKLSRAEGLLKRLLLEEPKPT